MKRVRYTESQQVVAEGRNLGGNIGGGIESYKPPVINKWGYVDVI